MAISQQLLDSPELGGIHFTGSTAVFNSMWKKIGENIGRYRGYPRLVGETGGKDFIVVHASADPQEVAVAIARGGFEYQGQKCSAASRVYVPESLWGEVRDRTIAMMKDIKMGDVRDFRNFMGAVIDKKAFTRISELPGRREEEREGAAGRHGEGDEGYFIEPTLVETSDPGYRLLCEEIFGPVVTAHVYPDAKWEETLAMVDRTSPYALTGAVFARDRAAVRQAASALRNAAGNFYINDKPTGAVVGQQPFGGARGSGTNDKAGSKLNLRPLGQRAHGQGDLRPAARLQSTRSWPRNKRDSARRSVCMSGRTPGPRRSSTHPPSDRRSPNLTECAGGSRAMPHRSPDGMLSV